MRLVEDDGSVIRQNLAELVAPDVEVGEEQVMVDDDDVSSVGTVAHACDEARLELGAFLADADVAAGVDAVPEREVLWHVDELAAVAGVGFAHPGSDVAKMIKLIKAVKDRLAFGFVDAVEAGVVAATFHIGGREFARQDLLQERDVLFHQLFLQVLGAGRDDDALLVGERGGDGGHEIGEGFTRAGAGLDHEVLFVLKGAGNGACHLDLALAVFEVFVMAGDQAAASENGFYEI